MEIVRFSIAVLLFASGLFMVGVATLGLFRLGNVLNRIHAASCNMMGAMLILIGCCVLTGISFVTLKIVLLLVFIWLYNPVVFHMMGRAEVLTNPFLEDEVEVVKR